jgi:serine protease Do
MSGLSVDDLSPAVAQQLDLPAGTTGVVIVNVEPGSAAAEAGLRRGDVISEVARKPVGSVAEFNQAIRAAGTDDVLLLVNRGGNSMFVVVESR